MSHTTAFTLKEAANLLTSGLNRSDNQLRKYGSPAFMLWGPPGVGKSSIVAQLCDYYKWGFKDLRLSQMAPTDLRGLPIVDTVNITSRWAHPHFLPLAKDINEMIDQGLEGFVLFLDEVNSAPAQTQAAGYQLVLDRAVGEYVIPKVDFPKTYRPYLKNEDGSFALDTEGNMQRGPEVKHPKAGQLFPIHVLLAGNRSVDKGVTHQMPAPLLNRMGHIEVEASVSEFVEYGMRKGLDHRVVSFIGYHDSKEKLLRLPSPGERSFPTPRSWEFAAAAIEDRPWSSDLRALVASFVGEGAATELAAHAEIVSKLPDLNQILRDGNIPQDFMRQKDGAAPDINIALKWSYVSSLTGKVMNMAREGKLKDTTIDHWMKALGQLEAEFTQMGVIVPLQSGDMKIVSLFAKNKAYRQWNQDHAAVIL